MPAVRRRYQVWDLLHGSEIGVQDREYWVYAY
jgi:hypothetical protein